MTSPPTPVSYPNIWAIKANPKRLESAAAAWRSYAKVAAELVGEVDTPAQAVYDGRWAGRTADEFDQHRRRLTTDLRETGDLAARQADQLAQVAAALRAGQSRLDDALARLTGQVDAERSPDGSRITFYPQDQGQRRVVSDGLAEARWLREQVDGDLLTAEAALYRLAAEWELVAKAWESIAGGADPFWLPPEATGAYVLADGTSMIINTGPGDDRVYIRVDPSTGHQVVEVNGVQYRFAPGVPIVVRTGQGRDTITIAPGTALRLTLIGGTGTDDIRGGDGDETILGHTGDDFIHAGAGDDRVSGGAGRDYIDGYRGHDRLAGGAGDDVIYGLSGADRISGGAGRDYLEGGGGADSIDGGAGADVLSGGRDNDALRGGAGFDRIYAGQGRDSIAGGTGDEIAYAERTDVHSGVEQLVIVEIRDLAPEIRIEGSDEFVERVQADLDLLRSSPVGQQMLTALEPIDGGSSTLVIRETADGNQAQPRPSGFLWLDWTYTVDYNPDRLSSIGLPRPPVVGLFHELGHVYDFRYHTAAPGVYQGADNPDADNHERAVVGLPVDLDEDGQPDGLWPEHPPELTENALRREMGWPDRTRY